MSLNFPTTFAGLPKPTTSQAKFRGQEGGNALAGLEAGPPSKDGDGDGTLSKLKDLLGGNKDGKGKDTPLGSGQGADLASLLGGGAPNGAQGGQEPDLNTLLSALGGAGGPEAPQGLSGAPAGAQPGGAPAPQAPPSIPDADAAAQGQPKVAPAELPVPEMPLAIPDTLGQPGPLAQQQPPSPFTLTPPAGPLVTPPSPFGAPGSALPSVSPDASMLAPNPFLAPPGAALPTPPSGSPFGPVPDFSLGLPQPPAMPGLPGAVPGFPPSPPAGLPTSVPGLPLPAMGAPLNLSAGGLTPPPTGPAFPLPGQFPMFGAKAKPNG